MMASTHSYACRDYPGMEACPFQVTTESENEVMELVALHAAVAHGEDPAAWSEADKDYLRTLIRSE